MCGSARLVDPADELRVGLYELGSCLLCSFELPRLAAELGPLAFENLGVGFGRVLPGTFCRLQGGGTDREASAAAVPGEESAMGILDAAEVVFVGSASDLEILVSCSDGCVRPPSGAGPEVGQVLFEDGLLFSYLDELIGNVRRDTPDEFSVLSSQPNKTLGGSGLVGGPLLATLVIPGPGEALRSLGEVRCGGVDVAGLPGSAHGHVGELAATTVVEDVGDFDCRALGAMSGDRVAVAEAVGANVIGAHEKAAAVGRDRGEGLGLRVDGSDPGSLRCDPGAVRSGGKGDDLVAGPVDAPSGCCELWAGEPPGALPQLAGSAVERLDVGASVGEKERVPSGVDVGRPSTDHAGHRSAAVGHRMDSPVAGIPADGGGDVAVAELRERYTFGWVGLAQVVGESPELLGVAFGEGGERATRADGTELPVVSYDDQLCPRSLDGREKTGEVDI
jgi:hypothetical protein